MFNVIIYSIEKGEFVDYLGQLCEFIHINIKTKSITNTKLYNTDHHYPHVRHHI